MSRCSSLRLPFLCCSRPSSTPASRPVWLPQKLDLKAVDTRVTQSAFTSTSSLRQRSRLSQIWLPTGGIVENSSEDGHSKLLRAGFLRQAHSGIFHMLHLGLRVQDKVEKLIDRHMQHIGASKLDLSSISSQELWQRSGRLNKIGSELFVFEDRKSTEYLLSPTHEEEVTRLVADNVKSHKELPLRLYQISRKYRDELRPRHGLLRSREFMMKDLYTFDASVERALQTYHAVRQAYREIFDELKIPYLVADADSGDMGGNLSHEYHFPTHVGEDLVINCQHCGYVANEELVKGRKESPSAASDTVAWSFEDAPTATAALPSKSFTVWRGISRDRATLINVWYPATSARISSISHECKPSAVNMHAIKAIVPGIDTGVEKPAALWLELLQTSNNVNNQAARQGVASKIVNVIDYRLPPSILDTTNDLPIFPGISAIRPVNLPMSVLNQSNTEQFFDVLRVQDGDPCPRCSSGSLRAQKAIELGHTFFLGTRYSEPLQAVVHVPQEYQREVGNGRETGSALQNDVPMQMGCHGIGVSRMIGAVAEALADNQGLNWPRVICPYEIVIIPTRKHEDDAMAVHEDLCRAREDTVSNTADVRDIILDDRQHSFAWKMKDADLIGYPVVVVVGRKWKEDNVCEVQCRRLGIKEDVSMERVYTFIESLLVQL